MWWEPAGGGSGRGSEQGIELDDLIKRYITRRKKKRKKKKNKSPGNAVFRVLSVSDWAFGDARCSYVALYRLIWSLALVCAYIANALFFPYRFSLTMKQNETKERKVKIY